MTTYTDDCKTDMLNRTFSHDDTFKTVLVRCLIKQFPSLMNAQYTVFNSRLYKELLSPFYDSARVSYDLKCQHENPVFNADDFPSIEEFWREVVKEYWVVMITVNDIDIAEVLNI